MPVRLVPPKSIHQEAGTWAGTNTIKMTNIMQTENNNEGRYLYTDRNHIALLIDQYNERHKICFDTPNKQEIYKILLHIEMLQFAGLKIKVGNLIGMMASKESMEFALPLINRLALLWKPFLTHS